MKAFNQFIKEFWIPIVLGLTWAILSTYNNSESFTLSFIKNFGACFFLTSWLGGQILRIIKQQKLDKNFDNVFLKIDDITNRLERVTHDIRGYITGGESFCYLEVNRYEKGSIAALMHEGQFPLYQVGIALNDLKNPEKDPRKWTRIEVGDMSPGLVKTVEEADLKLKECDDNLLKYEVHIYSRNGHYVQDLRLMKFEGRWYSALQLRRKNGEVFYSKIAEKFPLKTPFN